VKDLTEQMGQNIGLAQNKGVLINDLQDKTDNLARSADDFKRTAHHVRKEMWWKNMKMRICIVVGIIILLIVIIVPSGTHAPKILTSLSLTSSSCRFKTYLIISAIVVVTLESVDTFVSSESLEGQCNTTS
jgi:Synaptobrevin